MEERGSGELSKPIPTLLAYLHMHESHEDFFFSFMSSFLTSRFRSYAHSNWSHNFIITYYASIFPLLQHLTILYYDSYHLPLHPSSSVFNQSELLSLPGLYPISWLRARSITFANTWPRRSGMVLGRSYADVMRRQGLVNQLETDLRPFRNFTSRNHLLQSLTNPKFYL